MIIAIDFDGTIVEHRFPEIGNPLPDAFETLKKWQFKGHELILWTCREDKLLLEALYFCEGNGLYFHAINENVKSTKIAPRKVYADWYIDDRAMLKKIDWKFLDTILQIKEIKHTNSIIE